MHNTVTQDPVSKIKQMSEQYAPGVKLTEPDQEKEKTLFGYWTAAEQLGIGKNLFLKWLRLNGWVMPNNKANPEHIRDGLMDSGTNKHYEGNTEVIGYYPKFTPKGLQLVKSRYKEQQSKYAGHHIIEADSSDDAIAKITRAIRRRPKMSAVKITIEYNNQPAGAHNG